MNSSEVSPHFIVPEPNLSFHPERLEDSDIHPLRGLISFGPYSKGLVPDPIRVATISPFGEGERLYSFMRELNYVHSPKERREYLPKWPGFGAVFGVKMRAASRDCHIALSDKIDGDIEKSDYPQVVLADALTRALQILDLQRSDFDVVFIYLPVRWEKCFYGSSGDEFDLHDYLKAVTAARRTPLQLVREDKAIAYHCRASVMWRVGLALYTKAGGIPWKLADASSDVAYIGISYAIRSASSDKPKFVTCCSQVFDAEGSGLEFIAYDAREVEVQRDNPFLSRSEMFRVMTRSVDLYRRRHAGQSPRRVIVHKSTEFKRDEVDACMEAFHLCEAVDLVQVVSDVSWRGVRIDGKDEPAGFPVARGTVLPLGVKDALLWIHGNVEGVANGPYFQGKRSTPRPIQLIRHAGHGPWDDTARSALALSKMNWNNDSLYDPLPVTMSYAQVLARVVKRMGVLVNTPYQFRFFM